MVDNPSGLGLRCQAMQITIHRRGFPGQSDYTQIVDAEPIGDVFAINETPGLGIRYNLTHVPTGYAILTGVKKPDAEAAGQELLAGGLDWAAVLTPDDLTPEHKTAGKALRQKWGDKGW